MLKLPQTPRGRVVMYGGGAALVLLVVYLVHRHRALQAEAADTSGLGLVEDPYANIGPSPEYGYGSTMLSPITSGGVAGGGDPGGSVTTYTAADLMGIIDSLSPAMPTPAAAPTPTPNVTPAAAPMQPLPPPPPTPAPAPAPRPAPPPPPPAPRGNGCPADYPHKSDRGCYKDCGHDECRNHRVCRNHGHCYRNGQRVTLSVDCGSRKC